MFFKQANTIAYFTKQYSEPIEAAKAINPIWPITTSIIIATVVIYRKYLPTVNKTLTYGTIGALLPIFNTSSENGYGGVIKLILVLLC